MRVFGDGDVRVPVQKGIHQIPEPVAGTLLVVVDKDDVVPVRVMTAADQRVVPPAVLGQVNGQDLRIILRLLFDHCQKTVRRAVVDGNDLISKIRPLSNDLTYFIDDESYGPFAVVARDDEADQLPPALMDGINIHVNPIPER